MDKITRVEREFADEDPLGGEEELEHDELSVFALEVDAHVAGVLQGQVRHVLEVHVAVISELVLLVREVNLRLFENLDDNFSFLFLVGLHPHENNYYNYYCAYT